MAVSAFDDKSAIPSQDMVTAALADTAPLWDDLQSYIKARYPDIAAEWKHYGKSAGWSCKLISKKRNLLFFVPRNGCFRVRIGFGERGAACVESSDLPEEIKEAYRTATPYVEGRSIDIDVSRREQLEAIKTLLEIKFAN